VIGGDEDAMTELIGSFLDEGPKLLARLKVAAETSEPAELRRAAHTLKSSARDFGAGDLAQLCLELETRGKAEDLDQMAGMVRDAEYEYHRAEAALNKVLAGFQKADVPSKEGSLR
jgi:HPt (histidine-containing phosphotransfer) domain-containing protein